jgi:tetratricopeptide (TPR) repeat protein
MRPEADLQQTFERIWSEIRGAKLAGGPRHEASAHSLSLAQNALKLATESGSEAFLVEAWRMLAYTLSANEQYQEGIPYYRKTIEKLELKGDMELAARTRIGYVTVLAYAGQYQEALEAARPAQRWFAERRDEEACARLLLNIGLVYNRINDWSKAVSTYEEAREIFTRLKHKEGIARISHNLANVLSNVDQFERADQLYQQCRNLSDELQLHDLAAQAGYNRAYLHYLRGRYSDALHSFGTLRQEFEMAGSDRHRALCDLDEA